MVMLNSARRNVPVPALAWWLVGLGIAATLAANVAHGLGHDLTGAVVAARVAVALIGSCELLMMVIRNSQVPEVGTPETGHGMDPLQEQAAELFAGQLAADRVPSARDSLSPPPIPCPPTSGQPSTKSTAGRLRTKLSQIRYYRLARHLRRL
jgi:hypothetical protein